MKSERLLNAIGGIADELIAEAETAQLKKRKNKALFFKVFIPAAACLVAAFLIIPKQLGIKSPTSLPMISIGDFSNGGMGFEGYMANDIGELENENPWTEKENIKTLPVFKNAFSYDEKGNPPVIDTKLMEKTARETADLLGLKVNKITVNPSDKEIEDIIKRYKASGERQPAQAYDIAMVEADCGDVRISVNSTLNVSISFNVPVTLPKEYSFTHSTSTDEAEKTLKYLIDKYRALLKMKNPQAKVFADYTINKDRNVSYYVFDSSGTIEDKILGYNFNNAMFGCNDEGQLFVIHINRTRLSQKIGDYPIITSKEAKTLLLEKKYITSVPEAFPGEKYIKKVELVYRDGYDETLIPYYRFYVEMPSMALENGLKTYGAFYVPAVSSQYIKNMPIWDGSFN